MDNYKPTARYNLIYVFNQKRDNESFETLLNYFESEKEILKKAFCKGKNIFSNRRVAINNPNDFIEKNREIFDGNINENLYVEFIKSKQLDAIHEYSDTTKRILKATGIISFDNGYVELAYKELLKHIFKDEYIKDKIFGNIEDELSQYFEVYDEYEIGIESYYCKSFSICEIFEIYGKEIDDIINEIRSEKKSIVYLAPELLLATGLQTLLGERKIGLLVIDEAHTVTSWGRDFRSDYWFLGDFLKSVKKNGYTFPVLCLTSSAFNSILSIILCFIGIHALL